MQSDGRDLQYAHKLSMKHILVAGTERQNVRKAAELFSLTVGKAILYNFPEFTHVGESVIILNNGFDVLNSRIPVYGPYKLKSAYGNCLQEQDDALNKLYRLILTMRVIGKHKPKEQLLPFQKGFLMSINSLRGLFKDLKSENYTYIMASRCNQDILENYFSQIRGLGRFYDHPLPTIVTQRIKSLILSRHGGEVISSENCISDTEVQTLSADILSVVTQDSVPLLCEYDIDDNENERST